MLKYNVRKITGVGILLAIEIVLQVVAMFAKIGSLTINLSLLPIAFGAIIYGPFAGALLGAVSGIVSLFAVETQAFMGISAFWCIVVCVGKTALAGLFSGFIYKALRAKNNNLAIVIASLSVSLINTLIFVLSCLTVFVPIVVSSVAEGSNILSTVIFVFVGFNFFFEFGSTTLLTPVIIKIINIIKKEQY